MTHDNRNRVPDLIYHTTDSSTSNPSSPDEKRPSQRLPLHRSYGPPDAVLPIASDREHWWNPIYKMNEFPVTTVPSPGIQDTTLLTTDHYHEGYGMEYAPDTHLDLLYQTEPMPPVKRKLPHVLDPHFTEGCTLKL